MVDKKIILKVIFVLFLTNCQSLKDQDVAEKVTITIDPDKVVATMQGGIGCNFHALTDSVLPIKNNRSYAGSEWGANPEPDDTLAWKAIYAHLDWLGMDWNRMAVSLNMFEPQKGKFTPESKEMKILYRYLDYFQSKGNDVFLQHFFHNTTWLSPDSIRNSPEKKVRVAPNDIGAFTDGLTALLDHLINKKKYTCIRYFSLANEPFENWSWYIKSFDPDKFESPEPAIKMLSEKISLKNLPVKMSGPDISLWKGHPLHPDKQSLFPILEAYDIHTYTTRFDWDTDSTITFDTNTEGRADRLSELQTLVQEWKDNGTKNGNKPLFISELGTFIYGFGRYEEGIASYHALLKDAELVIRYANIGVDGFARWNFTNRGDLDGPWQMIDTYDFKTQKMHDPAQYQPHGNNYYMWGLLSRFTVNKSLVLSSDVTGGKIGEYQRVFASTLKNPTDDNFSVYVVNDSEKDFKTTLKFTNKNTLPQLFSYEINEKDHKEKITIALDPIKMACKGNVAEVNLKPKSITVFTTYNLKKGDKAVEK